MASLYYNNAQGDADIGNLANWWQDSSYTVPATALPTITDDVVIDGDILNDSTGTNVYYCKNYTQLSGNQSYNIVFGYGETARIYGSSIFGGFSLDYDHTIASTTAYFYDNSILISSIGGFNPLIGDAYFFNSSINAGLTYGYSHYFDNSLVTYHSYYGWAGGPADFHNNSGVIGYGQVYIGSQCDFYDNSFCENAVFQNYQGSTTFHYPALDLGGNTYTTPPIYDPNGTNYFWNGTSWGPPLLYYTNVSGDGTWETLANWNTASDGSGSSPAHIPWTDDGSGGAWYANYNLVDATGGSPINVYSVIDPNQVVSGSCLTMSPQFYNSVYGGTWTGDSPYFGGSIYGGLFTGADAICEDSGEIYGGTFSGNTFHSYNVIYGGTFTGNNLDLGGTVNGGTFSNNGMSGFAIINGGDFSQVTGLNYFGNSINGGIPPTYLFPPTELHYTNASGDATWENLANWFNPSSDGNTYGAWNQISNIPWTDNGSGGSYYGDWNLVDASSNYGIAISNSTTVGNYVTGSCNIFLVACFGAINGGTWNGDNNYANSQAGLGSGSINGGTFNGNNCGTDPDNGVGSGGGHVTGGTWNGSYYNAGVTDGGTFNGSVENGGTINGGLFTADGFTNYIYGPNVTGTINGGTFIGNNVSNPSGAYVNGGSFSGNNFQNNGSVSGITFSGDGFNNVQGAQVTNCDFTNGTGFTDWAIQNCYLGSTGTLNYNGHNYTTDGNISVVYPETGGGINVLRMLNILPYIKI
jgi:hypothetical protein